LDQAFAGGTAQGGNRVFDRKVFNTKNTKDHEECTKAARMGGPREPFPASKEQVCRRQVAFVHSSWSFVFFVLKLCRRVYEHRPYGGGTSRAAIFILTAGAFSPGPENGAGCPNET
jgi:hypothetical protein